jgi:hypothetical protein
LGLIATASLVTLSTGVLSAAWADDEDQTTPLVAWLWTKPPNSV